MSVHVFRWHICHYKTLVGVYICVVEKNSIQLIEIFVILVIYCIILESTANKLSRVDGFSRF